MGSRDRPHREAKKKPKDKSGLPKLTSLSEPPPQQAELIRKPRKPKPVEEEAEGKARPTQAVVAHGAAAHAGGTHPKATQASARGRGRDHRRGLIPGPRPVARPVG